MEVNKQKIRKSLSREMRAEFTAEYLRSGKLWFQKDRGYFPAECRFVSRIYVFCNKRNGNVLCVTIYDKGDILDRYADEFCIDITDYVMMWRDRELKRADILDYVVNRIAEHDLDPDCEHTLECSYILNR